MTVLQPVIIAYCGQPMRCLTLDEMLTLAGADMCYPLGQSLPDFSMPHLCILWLRVWPGIRILLMASKYRPRHTEKQAVVVGRTLADQAAGLKDAFLHPGSHLG